MPASNPGTTNLGAWWPLDSNGNDAHSGAHHLTTVGAVTYTTGIVGDAATSFATTRYMYTADHADLSVGTGDYTVCAWFYPNTAHTGVIVAKDGASSNREFDLDIDSGKVLFIGFNGGGGATTGYSGNNYTLNAWNFGVGRYNATSRVWTVRLNAGADVNLTALSSATVDGSADVSIGIRRADTAFPFNGRIDGPVIYRRRLTDDEIEWLYNSGAGRSYASLTAASGGPVLLAQNARWYGVNA